MTSSRIVVVGTGRMGSAVAERLARSGSSVRTWGRSTGSPLADQVGDADAVLLTLYDGPACLSVLDDVVDHLTPPVVVVNLSTVSPAEATAASDLLGGRGIAYVHAPVVGSTPAARDGHLTLLTGAGPIVDGATSGGVVREVLAALGEPIHCGSPAGAAAAKLVANGVLGDALVSLQHALRHGDALGLDRSTTLDVLSRTALGGLVAAKRSVLEHGTGTSGPAQFTIAALEKDLALLGSSTGHRPRSAAALEHTRVTAGLGPEDDIGLAALPAAGPGSSRSADLVVDPDVVGPLAAVEPLRAYVRGHATGDAAHFRDAFLPTAHVEGLRDGRFTSWTLDDYCALFSGPADDEPARRRVLTSLEVSDGIATAAMTLHHGPTTFLDSFVLLRDESQRWRIANKVYALGASG